MRTVTRPPSQPVPLPCRSLPVWRGEHSNCRGTMARVGGVSRVVQSAMVCHGFALYGGWRAQKGASMGWWWQRSPATGDREQCVTVRRGVASDEAPTVHKGRCGVEGGPAMLSVALCRAEG
jgi:hypothetical protein